MNPKKLSPTFNIVFWIVGILIFTYNGLRAFYVPFIHDEVTTFYSYIYDGDFIPFIAPWDANNHILNSLLSYFCYKTFGLSEFVLRLPNVLSLGVYLYFSFKILSCLSNSILKYLGMAALICAHFFIEYFALCRGYGISMALLVMGIYYTLLYLKNSSIKFLSISLLTLILSTFANLTIFNTLFISFFYTATVFILSVKKGKESLFNYKVIVFLGTLLLMGFFIVYGLALKSRGLLYYGSLDGFWDVTVKTLLINFTGEHKISGIFLICYSILMVYLFLKINPIKSLKLGIEWFKIPYHYLPYLLIVNVLITLVLGYALNTNFPEDRTGLYFYPLFVISILFVLDAYILRYKKSNYWGLGLLPFVFFPFHFLYSMNVSYNNFWKHEIIPDRFYQYLTNEQKSSVLPITIGGYFSDESVWAFSQNKRNKSHHIQSSDFQSTISDYAIYRPARNQKIPAHYSVVMTDSLANKSLIKRNKKLKKRLLLEHQGVEIKTTAHEYLNLLTLDSSQIKNYYGKRLFIHLKANIHEEKDGKLNSFLVFSTNHSIKEKQMYERMILHWYSPLMLGQELNYGMYLPLIPKDTKNGVFYIWNMKKKTGSIPKYRVDVYELTE